MHVFTLMLSLRTNKIILDGSDTGTGKTYTSIALCKQLDLRPFIICPKIMISTWKFVCDHFEVRPLGIVNYETIKSGYYYDKNNNKVKCPFLEIEGDENDKNINYKWKIPYYGIIIFDEVHKCKNKNSYNGKLLISTKEEENIRAKKNKSKNNNNNYPKVLMLSATISRNAESFHVFGYMLNFYKSVKRAHHWIKSILHEDEIYIGGKPKISTLNRVLYPSKGSRMIISDLGDKFPENQISFDAYYIEQELREQVNKYFNKWEEDAIKLKSNQEGNNNILSDIIKVRTEIEGLKLSIFEELANEYVEAGYNVAIFLNYNKNIEKLANTLNTTCIVNGTVDMNERVENIQNFQDNKSNIIICNISISTGFSLHDLHGRPRISLISPNYSGTDLIQIFGRITRAGQKTPALQKIIFCADTCEEILCNNLKNQVVFMDKINDITGKLKTEFENFVNNKNLL